MSEIRSEATAPSNIALIKYMGKTSHESNRPTNPSLSYTLDHLITKVRLVAADKDGWAPLTEPGFEAIQLSEKGQLRYLNFLSKLKSHFGITECFRVESANNFPSDCGIASSASSFAALTKAVAALAKQGDHSPEALSKLSRQGSGSSCRSLFTPWAVWKDEAAEPVDLGIDRLIHVLVLGDDSVKLVSSSEAHKRVAQSPLFDGRVDRAIDRFDRLMVALREDQWKEAYQICWQEFWDMHALFETSPEPFGYMNANSLLILREAEAQWRSNGTGPIVTMDAGANVHLMYKESQSGLVDEIVRRYQELGLRTVRSH